MSKPFVYDEAWRNIVNTGTVSVDVRQAQPLQAVWTSDATIALSPGEQRLITASGSDPFYNAVTPIGGIDYRALTGSVTTELLRRSGTSATIKMTAIGGAATVTALQLRAQPVTVAYTVQVSASDGQSVKDYGARSMGDLPWCGVGDAQSILTLAIAQRAQPLPIVQARFMVGRNTARAAAVLGRDLSDRVTLVESETLLNGDFYIESIRHELTGEDDHAVIFGLEAAPTEPANVARADVSGVGADQGVAGAGLDDPALLARVDSNVAGHRVDEGLTAA